MKVFVSLALLALAASTCDAGYSWGRWWGSYWNTQDLASREETQPDPLSAIEAPRSVNDFTETPRSVNDVTETQTKFGTEAKLEIQTKTPITFLAHITEKLDTLKYEVTRQDDFLATRYMEFSVLEGPVHGGFSEFSAWTPCTHACGGKAFRFRHCTAPAPRNGGRPCVGHTTEVKKCPNTCYRHSRLVDGPTHSAGRLEVLVSRQWTPVCRNNFTVNDAMVVCRNLGYSQTPLVMRAARFGLSHSKNVLLDLACHGSEKDLLHCPGIRNIAPAATALANTLDQPIDTNANTINHPRNTNTNTHSPLPTMTTTCTHEDDIAIDCEPNKPKALPQLKTPLVMTDVRLEGGDRTSRGRFEIQANKTTWGTVCDHGFTANTAIVACRNLNLLKGFEPITYMNTTKPYLPARPILVDDLHCTGNEPSIDMCPRRPLGQHSCYRSEDVFLDCRPDLARPGVAPDCPGGFVPHHGFCYMTSTTKLTKPQAAKECVKYNAHLLEVRSKDESNFITNLMSTTSPRPDYLWMGINMARTMTHATEFQFDTDMRRPAYHNFEEIAGAETLEMLAPLLDVQDEAMMSLDTDAAWENEETKPRCVGLTPEGTWVMRDCQATAAFVCQTYGKIPQDTPITHAH